ncbi:Myb/SANT-like domain-containing protein [Arachis hypogaea]|uniref:Myb/SANT-like domain-containing protein n=1 Tax=Arachis hypogaea TaxID=3818 RepID=A0A6B9V4Z3_ARAHY|nr:Myb/SANT-like domain-containing protein [Arachis hypogaea]
MDSDPKEDMSLENEQALIGEEHGDNQDGDDEIIDSVEGSNEWTVWQDNLAHEIHVWTDEETEVFVGFMEELVIEGRIADAGQFRPGSFEKLTAKMNERFSGGGFQITHCKNKVKRLKEKYQFAADMAACSGFGWDDVKQCVVVDNKEILTAYMKKQGVRLYTPGKPFPLYTLLEKIFCKERTNGDAAVCGNDAEEEVQMNGYEEIDEEDTDIFNSNHDCSESLLQQSNFVASSSGKKQGKKPSSFKAAKDTKIMKELTDTLKYVFDQQGKRLDAFAQAMVNTREEKKAGDVLSELGFTDDEVISIALKFSTNPQLEKNVLVIGK